MTNLGPLTRMRILIVVNDQRHFPPDRLASVRAALSAGWEVHLAAPAQFPAVGAFPSGMAFHPVDIPRHIGSPWREFRSAWQLRRLYRRLRPDLVHHLTAKPIIYGGLAARACAIPASIGTAPGLGIVFSRRGMRAAALRWLILRGFRLAMAHRNSVLITENEEDRDRLVRSHVVHAGRTAIIRITGVDMERFRAVPEPEGTVVVLLASRLLWDKGVGEFVAAGEVLRAQGVPVRMVLAGQPDPGHPGSIPAAQLRAWVRSGVVEWLGHHDDMPNLLAASHIGCLPSFYGEGLPRFLMEAAACGRPLVSTDWPGCREIVRHESTGLLVRPRDAPALAAALRRLIEQPELRKRLGGAARKLVLEEYTADKAVADTLQLYRNVLADIPRARDSRGSSSGPV